MDKVGPATWFPLDPPCFPDITRSKLAFVRMFAKGFCSDKIVDAKTCSEKIMRGD